MAEQAQATSYPGPWRISYEARDDDRVALISGIYTVLTVGDYYDGGSDEQAAALNYIAAADPDTILAVLSERDRLREALRELAPAVELAETILRIKREQERFTVSIERYEDLVAAARAALVVSEEGAREESQDLGAIRDRRSGGEPA